MGEFVAKKYDNTSHMVWWNGHGMICRTDSLGNAARIADALNAQAAPPAALEVPAEVCGCGKPADYMANDGGLCCNKYGVRCKAQQPAAAVPEGYVPVSALIDAREQVENWAAYASPYFQEKWDLAGTLAAMDAHIAAAERKGE